MRFIGRELNGANEDEEEEDSSKFFVVFTVEKGARC